ncbi:MAG TPA: GNAT family N-acetyltransferase [Gemmatimonadaceae bacterium]|nr:GNAT family N-acetyltransferase [Gemmatimonadaceae bacterium]
MPNAVERVEVTRTYLELNARPAAKDIAWPEGISLTHEDPCSVAMSRSLYAAVGRPYHWYDRDKWTDEQLAGHLAAPNVAVWALRDAAGPIGYFELARHDDSAVEIVYFGLAPRAQGKGLGKLLLESAIQAAFASQGPARIERVWLHTCTLDHPAALPNYKARGFVPFRTETYETNLAGAL